MNILELKNIGKIYATKNTVAVGIRGVNLSFATGEFVAITGQSGSGKSSLLNVIGGIDSYEEGEMFINGENTSHYLNEDWEGYRQKYISFIFQDYNIIENFTVFENVYIMLMHIENSLERRRKTMELITKVGLEKYANQKGSYLSGGQKQRTAIARALAKDSPIMLADEPTGNLDAKTSYEIIHLLKEVSRDKLLIIVTHNFDEVKEYATREICVFNGEISSDRNLREINYKTSNIEKIEIKKEIGNGRKIKNGIKLGWILFLSKPKLSMFITVFIALASLCIFFFTGIIGKEIKYNFLMDNHFFNEEAGRIIVIKRDGTSISDKEVEKLAEIYRADTFQHCDILCDFVDIYEWRNFMENPDNYGTNEQQLPFLISTETEIDKLDIGHYPRNVSECTLYIPYALSDYFGKDDIKVTSIIENGLEYRIVGIKYFADNNQIGKIILTKEGYQINSAMAYIGNRLKGEIVVTTSNGEVCVSDSIIDISYSFNIERDKIYIKLNSLSDYKNKKGDKIEVNFMKPVGKEDTKEFFYGNYEKIFSISDNVCYDDAISKQSSAIIINPYTVLEALNLYINNNYSQCSLYFNSTQNIENIIEEINSTGYIAIPSYAEGFTSKYFDIKNIFSGIWLIIIWCIAIFFLFIFLGLCTKKTLNLFSEDINIMRFVGINIRVLKISVYVRFIIAVAPAIVITLLSAFFVYHNTFGNRLIMYLYPVHYIVIFSIISFIVFGVTKKHVNRLFSTKIYKGMKGDELV